MKTVTIDHPHNEASSLLGVQNRGLLDRRGWDVGFWIVSDEKDGSETLALLGRKRRKWEVVPVKSRISKRSTAKATEDAESLARAGSWVYVIGSQFGSKDGPLEPKRHFVARFNESLIDLDSKEPAVAVDLVRKPFVLHRLINDALREEKIEVLPPGEELSGAFVRAAVELGEKKSKKWSDLVRKDDTPVNIEGATFLSGGHLLLGLRHPVTRDGHPIMVEIEGIDRYFDDDRRDPEVIAIRVLVNVGSVMAPAGIRELDSLDGMVHAITGDLDSKPERSAVLEDHPEGKRAPNEHWAFPLHQGKRGPSKIRGRRLRRFGKNAAVEGIAIDGDRCWYAHDDEKIVLEVGALNASKRTR